MPYLGRGMQSRCKKMPEPVLLVKLNKEVFMIKSAIPRGRVQAASGYGVLFSGPEAEGEPAGRGA